MVFSSSQVLMRKDHMTILMLALHHGLHEVYEYLVFEHGYTMCNDI